MNWLQLIVALLPIFEEVTKAIADATAAGKSTTSIHDAIVNHVAGVPAQIRSA